MNKLRKPIIIRYPVIPGRNDMEAAEIAGLLSGLNCVKRVDLIPYHPYGIGRYAQLGRIYPLQVQPIPQEVQQALKYRFEACGLKVQIGG